MQTIPIKAKPEDRYLTTVLPEGLPKNCLFDKVTTGCGGTYVALKSSEPYILAVPTKALVYDKVTSKVYADCNVEGVSEDFPLGDRVFSTNQKIVVTYKSLMPLVEKGKIVPKDFNLLVDEMHMLTSMTGYAREELKWLMQNFKSFKSFCFMSATIPRREHLVEELRELTLYKIRWPSVTPVTFNCFIADNIQESILHLMVEHAKGIRKGRPYFFYNSVTGICSIIKKWKAQTVLEGEINVICSTLDANKAKLSKVKQEIGKPNTKADFHFITATAFEGVDFYDEDGVTYIISDRSYASTKYSIETTIPQIVGRLRDSKYNQEVTVIFSEHDKTIAMTPREFSIHLDTKQDEAKCSLAVYNDLLQRLENERGLLASIKGQLQTIVKDPNILIENGSNSFEDLLESYDMTDIKTFPKAEFYPYARIIAQQTYDLFHEERFVRGDQKGLGDPLSLGKLRGKAQGLTDQEAKIFNTRMPSLKTLCSMYEKDPKSLSDKYHEWFLIIEKVGVEVCKSYGYKKIDIRRLYEASVHISNENLVHRVQSIFRVGKWYRGSYIKDTLTELGIDKPKATTLRKWFEIERVPNKGVSGYRIIRKL